MRVAARVALGLVLAGCGNTAENQGNPDGGAVDGGSDADLCDVDRDGHESLECGGADCDDANRAVHPGATETCDGDDNDCDGTVDPADLCDCAAPPADTGVPFGERACLKGGWFWMGMAVTDPAAHELACVACPVHRVFVSPFYLDKYEVTNRRYLECMSAGVCEVDTDPLSVSYWNVQEHSTEEMLDRPFLGGSALDAEKYCEWAGGWLPSEAQWERAAAGLGDEPRPYPSGYVFPTCDDEWAKDCVDPPEEFPIARRVGLKRANPEGIFDLGGNAIELTADLFSREAYEQCSERCKNPCFGCADRTGGAPQPTPTADWQWGHVMRGAPIESSFELSHFFRTPMRDFAPRKADENRFAELFNHGFRCAYRARPKG